MSSESAFDRCRAKISNYFEKYGMEETLKVFNQEIESSSSSSKNRKKTSAKKKRKSDVDIIDEDLDITDVAITLSLNGKMKHLTEVYFDQYAKLHDFALSSLDMYRNELLSICFSVFVYVYKQLVENDDMERAARLLKYFGKEFETSEPFAMGELRTVGTSKTLLAKNTFIRKFLKRKNIKIVSSYTVELLFMFLNRSDLFIMACAVLNRVKFKIKGQQPSLRQTTKRARTSSKKQKNSKIDMQSQFKCHTLFGATSLKWKCQNEGKNRAKIRSSRDHDGVDIDDGTNGLKFQELSRDALPSSVCFTVLNSHSVGVTDMSVSSDASCVAIATEMSTVQTWDIRSGGNKLYNNQELVSHNQPVYAVDFCPSEVCHDTERINLLSASADRTVRLWTRKQNSGHAGGGDAEKFENVGVFTGHTKCVWDVSFSRCRQHAGYFFATGSSDQTACLYTVDRPFPVRVFKNEHRADVDKVMIHPNGNYLAAGTCSGEVHIWDVRTTSLKSQHVAQSRSCLGAVNSISFSTNGRLMAVAGQDNQILIWDFAYMNFPVAVLSGHESSIHSLEFCEGNSDILASGSSDCTVKIWDVSKFNGRTTPGRIKATSSTKNITTSVDTASTLFLLASFPTKRTPIYDLRFTDENLLLVAGVFSPMKAL